MTLQERHGAVHARRMFLAIALLAAVPCLPAQYRQPKAVDYVKILEDPHRIEHLKPEMIIQKLALKPGQVVADIGSGSGLFTCPMAKAVKPDGKVYAVDIDRELLGYVSKRAAENGIDNIVTVLAPEDSPSLPRGSIDLALICDTLHHIARRETYLTNLRECLKPNGRLVIIDFSTGWPAGHESMRFSLDDLAVWTQAAGFVKIAEYPGLEGNFFHVYTARGLGR